MPKMLLFFIVFVSVNNAENVSTNDLPECPFIHPVENMEKWNNFNFSSCNITNFTPIDNSSIEHERYSFGFSSYSFNILVSDLIGPRRHLPFMAHEKCRDVDFKVTKKASIVIIYHNEGFSVLVRMINSILDRTPLEILHEIILFDDYSEEKHIIENHLIEYSKIEQWETKAKFRFLKSERREGLIKAKVSLFLFNLLVFLLLAVWLQIQVSKIFL